MRVLGDGGACRMVCEQKKCHYQQYWGGRLVLE
jgi:hypothetical protein